jgi:hypothetical protein
MKMKNKYLILIQNKKNIDDLRALNVNYVLPLKSFSIGFSKTFEVKEIPNDSFVLVNVLFDNSMLKKFMEILKKIKIKGIIFTDVGLINLLKPFKFEKVFFANHLMTNYESINEMLKYCDSLFLSTDITNEECNEILKRSPKKLTIYGLGLVNIMNSKRHLVSNYNSFHQLHDKDTLIIKNNNIELFLVENKLGTVIYKNTILNNLSLGDNSKVKYIFINSLNIPFTSIIKLLKENSYNFTSDKGFAYTKTTYKIKGGE